MTDYEIAEGFKDQTIYYSKYIISSGIWHTKRNYKGRILNPQNGVWIYPCKKDNVYVHQTLEEAELMAAQVIEIRKKKLQNQINRLTNLTAYKIRTYNETASYTHLTQAQLRANPYDNSGNRD